MILWTIQHKEAYATLLRDGVLHANEATLAFTPDDQPNWHVYLWYAKQMQERIGPSPQGVRFPVWAWYKQQGKTGKSMGKPDMRQSAHGQKGDPVVRMKLDIPENRVLLSDFDAWHTPLNYSYLSYTEQEDDEFCNWHESLGFDIWSIRPKNEDENPTDDLSEVRKRIETSWQRIFELYTDDGSWHFPYELQSIQATFWELRIEDVVSTENFVLR